MSDHAAAPLFADLGEAHRRMAAIRAFEEVAAEAHRDGRLPGLLHLSIGAEAVTVGVIAQLGDEDRIFSAHRPHGHFLAAGEDPEALFAELAGRERGLCRGRGGSMHLMGNRAILATGIVGGSLPIAVGYALALPPGAAAVCFFGDGAVQTGVFHESLNLAALWATPVLFVCENNGMAEFSTREEHTNVKAVADYGALHRLPARTVDGTDVDVVAEAAAELLAGVRGGSGPAILECVFTRLRPHYEGDWREHEQSQNDAMLHVERALEARGATAQELDAVRAEAAEAARGALERALDGPTPTAAEDAGLVFARAL